MKRESDSNLVSGWYCILQHQKIQDSNVFIDLKNVTCSDINIIRWTCLFVLRFGTISKEGQKLYTWFCIIKQLLFVPNVSPHEFITEVLWRELLGIFNRAPDWFVEYERRSKKYYISRNVTYIIQYVMHTRKHKI